MNTSFRNGDGRRDAEKQDTEAWVWYQDLVERIPAVLHEAASDESGSALYVSPQIEALLGYAPEELPVDPELREKILHPEDRECVLAEHTRTRETGEPFLMEYRLITRDGQVVRVRVRHEAAPLPGANGHSGSRRGVLLDITERKRAEEALRRSEERHRLVARATGEAIWDNDLITGKQVWAGATEALFGYAPHESTQGKWWEDRIHPEDRARVLSGLGALLESTGDTWTDEYRFRRADGSYAVVVDRGYVVRDGNGRAVRMVGSMADVTERRQWEEKLKESEERFRRTFEAAAVGMADVAPDGRWIRTNGRFREITGYTRQELPGITYLDLTPAEDREAAMERVRRALEGEIESYMVERRYVRKDGRRAWVNLSVTLVRKSTGEPDYFVCVAEDITGQKIAELVPDPLTPRELEVLKLIARWRTNQEIARSLAYSTSMIKSHVRCILDKLGVKGRREAVTRAVRIGLIAPPR